MKICEAITVVSKFGGFGLHFKAEGASKFADVAVGDWYFGNVKYLEDKGLLNFFGTNLRHEDAITRAEFVSLLIGFGSAPKGSIVSFSDVKEGDRYYDVIINAASQGLVN